MDYFRNNCTLEIFNLNCNKKERILLMEQNNSTNQCNCKNGLSIASLILLLPSLWVWGAWIKTVKANPSLPQDEKVEIFLGYFPAFIKSVGTTSYIVLLSCIACIAISAIGLKHASRPFRIVGIIIIVVASLITLLQLFTLM